MAGAEILTIIVFFICGIRVTWLLTETKGVGDSACVRSGRGTGRRSCDFALCPMFGCGDTGWSDCVSLNLRVPWLCWPSPSSSSSQDCFSEVLPVPKSGGASSGQCDGSGLSSLGDGSAQLSDCCLLTGAHRDLWEFITHG